MQARIWVSQEPSDSDTMNVMRDAAPRPDDRSRTLLGVRIRDLGRDGAIALIDETVSRGDTVKVCFANAQTLNLACGDERYRNALRTFVVLNDGLGADIASRIKYGVPFQENLNGTDFIPDFLARTTLALRIYLVGSTDAVAARAAEALAEAFARHTIVGHRNGFFSGPQDIEQTCCDIRKSDADCLLVGMGNPLQEFWIGEHGANTSARLLFGVGAFLDFQAGNVPRAPQWVRQLRCEWMFRLLQEPVRLARRYLIGNFVFLGRVLFDARR